MKDTNESKKENSEEKQRMTGEMKKKKMQKMIDKK